MRMLIHLGVLGGLCVLASNACLADQASSDATETISVFGEGELKVPAAFKKGERKSRIIAAEYVASVGEGDDAKTARVYGMAAGGGVKMNLDRWKGQFTKSPEGAFQQKTMQAGNWKIYLVDHAGSFAESIGPPMLGRKVMRDNYAMTGAILENKAGRHFFVKMVGPTEVIKANRDDFIKMIKSIGE